MVTIELTPEELASVTAHLANEMETYSGPYTCTEDGAASVDFGTAFMKFVDACETVGIDVEVPGYQDRAYVTTLMAKWAGIIRNAAASGSLVAEGG